MDNKSERIAYKNWFDSAFTAAEKETLSNIGIECGAEHNFFKYEVLDIADFLRKYKLKKNPDLYEKIIDRYISLIPKFLHSKIDREMLKTDEYYVAWFFNRHCFFEAIRQAKEKPQLFKYLLWSPIVDSRSPDECIRFKSKLFENNDELLDLAIEHWSSPKVGCRCSLIMQTENRAAKHIEDGSYTVYKNS